jgi:amino acid permease
MLTTWYRFNQGLKAQGLDKKPGFLPFKSKVLPYLWYYAFAMSVIGAHFSDYSYLVSLTFCSVLCISGWYGASFF